jgi:hypothetical protein
VVDPFSIHMEISIFGGIILALPAMLFFAGQFLLPALMPREKRYLGPVFAAGTLLFILGVVFCYSFVLRTALQFFLSYSSYLGFEATWTAKELIDFEVQMLIGFGLAFEFRAGNWRASAVMPPSRFSSRPAASSPRPTPLRSRFFRFRSMCSTRDRSGSRGLSSGGGRRCSFSFHAQTALDYRYI